MFLGYAQGGWGYRLWCLELNSPVISKKVTFDEFSILLGRSVYGFGCHLAQDGVVTRNS